MSSKNSRLRVAFLALVVALTGLAMAGPAAAATRPTAPAVSTSGPAREAPVLTDFVDLPTSSLPSDNRKHKVTLTYRNTSSADLTVAPQLLLESPDAGPVLAPSDVEVEHRTADGCWEEVRLGTQTGTLFTDLTTTQRTLSPGETLTEHYRVTVLNPSAQGTLHPRVALYS
ncbi:hypothetical protein [Streptomyces cellulosae]|uniref:hypothetical protein n=1 Tax=Streptomyces cellulosae TaxID=1968 RepID=UPI0004C6E18D|nr:hypothetical protein [Streptomyces cellulosae]